MCVCSSAVVRMSVFHSGGNATPWTTAEMDLMSRQIAVSNQTWWKTAKLVKLVKSTSL